ncbi:MAG: hypothetical protein HDS44_03660 [Bacteroides sp.]|nr:hypothetical protein [Bacteroides sp.]
MIKNDKYNEVKNAHPHWSDAQIWTSISMTMEADNVIEKKGENIRIDDPDTIKEIIEGAKKWLAEVLPVIYKKVSELFDRLLTNVRAWVKKGWESINEFIETYFQKI